MKITMIQMAGLPKQRTCFSYSPNLDPKQISPNGKHTCFHVTSNGQPTCFHVTCFHVTSNGKPACFHVTCFHATSNDKPTCFHGTCLHVRALHNSRRVTNGENKVITELEQSTHSGIIRRRIIGLTCRREAECASLAGGCIMTRLLCECASRA